MGDGVKDATEGTENKTGTQAESGADNTPKN